MKTKSSLILSLFLVVLFTCGIFNVFAAPAQNNFSFAQAKEIALKKVGSGFIVKAELDCEKGKIVYELDVVSGSNKYEVKIDSEDGRIIKYSRTNNNSELVTVPQHNVLDEDQAMQIALARVGSGTVIKLEKNYQKGLLKYEIKLLDGSVIYELDIDAGNGQILKQQQKPAKNMVDNARITEDQACEIALVKVGQGQVARIQKEHDDSRRKYEITIVDGKTRYDVNVDANTGNILKYEEKAIYVNKIRRTSEMLTPQKAIEIAQANAGMGVLIKCELGYESKYGVATYEIEIVSEKNIKHEYEINAVNGSILEYEIDYL